MSSLFPESLQRDVVEGKWADAVGVSAGTWWAVAVAPTPTCCASHPLLTVPFSVSQKKSFSVSLVDFYEVDRNGGCCGTHARHAHAGVGTLPPVPMHTFGSLAVQYNHALHPNEPP